MIKLMCEYLSKLIVVDYISIFKIKLKNKLKTMILLFYERYNTVTDKLSNLNYTFIEKPLFVGGIALEYHDVRKMAPTLTLWFLPKTDKFKKSFQEYKFIWW